MKMKKVFNELKTTVQKLEGKVLLIGNYSDDINQILLHNKKVFLCEQLTCIDSQLLHDKKADKSKKINIKKLKKRYRKNGIDHLLVLENQIKDFKNTFVRDSLYIVKNKIYLVKSKESEQIIKMYFRYLKTIEIIPCLDGEIVCIDVRNYKNNKMKNLWFYVIDCLTDVMNAIGDILVD